MRAHFRTHALALLLIEGRVQVEMNVILGGAALGAIYALATAHIRMSRFGDERYVLDKRAFPDRRAVLTGDAVKRSTVRRQMFPVPEFDMGASAADAFGLPRLMERGREKLGLSVPRVSLWNRRSRIEWAGGKSLKEHRRIPLSRGPLSIPCLGEGVVVTDRRHCRARDRFCCRLAIVLDSGAYPLRFLFHKRRHLACWLLGGICIVSLRFYLSQA